MIVRAKQELNIVSQLLVLVRKHDMILGHLCEVYLLWSSLVPLATDAIISLIVCKCYRGTMKINSCKCVQMMENVLSVKSIHDSDCEKHVQTARLIRTSNLNLAGGVHYIRMHQYWK